MDDKDYFYRRAESELEMAQKTVIPEAVKAHYTLAGYYLDKVYCDQPATLETHDVSEQEDDATAAS